MNRRGLLPRLRSRARGRGALPRALPLFLRGEVRVAVDEAPLALDAPVDVGDPDPHWPRGPAVHDDLAALETGGVSEVAAGEHDGVVGDQPPALEAAAHPAKRFHEPAVPLLDRPPG